jgi:UDP-glucose 4-epimerase
MKRVMDGEPLTIYGDGEQTRDFVFVNDLCGGIVAALESGLGGEVFHLGSGTETSVNELVTLIVDLFPHRDVRITHAPERAGEIQRNYSDISKARGMLGFDASVDLATGLAKTRDWFLEAYGS